MPDSELPETERPVIAEFEKGDAWFDGTAASGGCTGVWREKDAGQEAGRKSGNQTASANVFYACRRFDRHYVSGIFVNADIEERKSLKLRGSG